MAQYFENLRINGFQSTVPYRRTLCYLLRGGGVKKSFVSQSRLESGARAGDSPLDENNWSP